jgi:general stress protein YciG
VNGGTAFKVEDCLKNAVDEVFTGTDFAKNWDNALAEPFGKKLKEAKAALDAAKRLAADAAEAEKIAAAGGIPGVVARPEGGIRCEYGLDPQVVEKMKKLMRTTRRRTPSRRPPTGFPSHKVKLDSYFLDRNQKSPTAADYEFCRDTGRKGPKHCTSPKPRRRKSRAGNAVDVDSERRRRARRRAGRREAKGDDRVPPPRPRKRSRSPSSPTKTRAAVRHGRCRAPAHRISD